VDFEFTDDQLELRESARTVLRSACPPSLVRAVYDGTSDGGALWSTLVGLDWPALGIAEAHGGLGLGPVEVGIVVEELGRAVAPSPYLATVTQLVPMLREAGATALLPDVAAGRCTGTVAIAEDGQWRVDAVRTTAHRRDGGWVLHGAKSHVLDGTSADHLAVIARLEGSAGADGLGVLLVPGAAVEATASTVIDPTQPVASVVLDGVRIDADAVVVDPGDPQAAGVIERATQEAVTALALSIVATCRHIFEMTLQHAKDREQFGRPIGSFQALKHRLADVYLAVERASSLAYFAALTLAEDDPRRAVAASMAKAAAGECQRLVVRDGLQLHGGIGYTWEHDLHLLLKRAKSGDLLFGGAAAHRARLAQLLGLEAA
jgi:alkylation response protein AidB-like acyl-CoA dehydrogenase